MNINEGSSSQSEIFKKLRKLTTISSEKNALIAVTRYVASGKSRFTASLQTQIPVLLSRKLFVLPFDFWVNANNLSSNT